MITFRHKGDFSNTTKFLKNASRRIVLSNLHRYGKEGVAALASATPVDTGKTASSWYYEITEYRGGFKISFANSNIQNGWCSVAIILQYGHATRNGGWVEGRDYINPAIQPIFDKIADQAWKEVVGL